MTRTIKLVIDELTKHEDPKKAQFLQKFFKTGRGQYGEGDIFLGVNMPTIRRISKDFITLSNSEIEKLLESPIHECRMLALIIMVNQFKKASELERKKLFNLYLANTSKINNWDLVDVSCRDIVGEYLLDKDRQRLYQLAKSKNLWERRIAIVSTWYFIKHNQLEDTFKISIILIDDKHDLIHKAVGWMLREAGKKDEQALKDFLNKYANKLPRTALRYSLEKLPNIEKQYYMQLT